MLAGLGQPPLLLKRPAKRQMRSRPLLGRQRQYALPAGNRLARLLALVLELGQVFPERRVGRLQLDGLLEPDQGVVELALFLQDQPQVGLGQGQLRVEPQRLEVRRPGLDEPVEPPQDIAQVVVQGRQVRGEPDRLLAVRQRLLRLAAVEQHLAEVRPRRGERRLELDGTAERLQRLVAPAQIAQGDAQVILRRGEVGPQLQGTPQGVDGLGRPPQSLQRHAQVAERLGIVGPQLQRGAAAAHGPFQLPAVARYASARFAWNAGTFGRSATACADQLHRPRVLPLLVMQHAQQMHRRGVRRVLRQHLLIDLRGRTQAAPPDASRWPWIASLAWRHIPRWQAETSSLTD